MIFNSIIGIVLILVLGIYLNNLATAQVDPVNDIEFLQTGELHTTENEFHISSELSIREFFDGEIVRISGQTIEGFPYVTYTTISDDKLNTHGKIFIQGKFEKLRFNIIPETKITYEKEDNILILVQYTQTVFSKNFANISMYLFDKHENTRNDYYQKEGRLSNINIEVEVVDSKNQEFYSAQGITDKFGFYETKFWIPDNYSRDTLTITIQGENENSQSSKILQLYTLGNFHSKGNSTKP